MASAPLRARGTGGSAPRTPRPVSPPQGKLLQLLVRAVDARTILEFGTLDAESADPKVRAQRRPHELISTDSRVEATTIQTVGGKGYDGFTIALVVS